MYGRGSPLLQYFLPVELDCAPPYDWRSRDKPVIGDEGWESASLVYTSRYQ